MIANFSIQKIQWIGFCIVCEQTTKKQANLPAPHPQTSLNKCLIYSLRSVSDKDWFVKIACSNSLTHTIEQEQCVGLSGGKS